MRILQIVADGSPGGGTTHVLQVLEHHSDLGDMILLTDAGSYLAKKSKSLGLNVIEERLMGSRLSRAPVQAIRQACRKVAPDIVHCHGGRACFHSSRSAHGLAQVYTVHGFHFAKKNTLPRLVGRLVERYCIGRSKFVIYVCHYDRQIAATDRLMSTHHPHRVIHNGIPVGDRAHQLNYTDSNIIGFVGRLVPQKNPLKFVEVMEHLPAFNGIVVGDGELRSSIEAAIDARELQGRVQLVGALDQSDVLKILPKFACLLMTSEWEGLPILPLEAMKLGIPVVASAVGGLPEIFDTQSTGILFKSELRPIDIAKIIIDLLHDPLKCQQTATLAHARLLEHFSEDAMIEDLRQVYDQLCGERNR
ncbi:glycosyltransferase [Rhodopirellula bahusiensis]|uniref:Glycosyl transferase family 1 n=1 Tax=Rhodopirellula bahusiensis TaxID=2014065 RepID=A0A2G1W5I3_9BACT|nr:glycosyltransferase [Rhodopirellula bahusiensis]PHQ34286.1 hypothetical protein CEE69_16805 [Rhodopirellula bahusiensis]